MENVFLDRRENREESGSTKIAQFLSYKNFILKWLNLHNNYLNSNEDYCLMVLFPLEFRYLQNNYDRYSFNIICELFVKELLKSLRSLDFITNYKSWGFLILLKTNNQNAQKIMDRVTRNMVTKEISSGQIKFQPSIKYFTINPDSIKNLTYKQVKKLLLNSYKWYQNNSNTKLEANEISWLSRYSEIKFDTTVKVIDKAISYTQSQSFDTWQALKPVTLIKVNFIQGYENFDINYLAKHINPDLKIIDYFKPSQISPNGYLVGESLGCEK